MRQTKRAAGLGTSLSILLLVAIVPLAQANITPPKKAVPLPRLLIEPVGIDSVASAATPAKPSTPKSQPRPSRVEQPKTFSGPLVCKIIVVNQKESSMTVEIDGKLQLVKMDPKMLVMKKGKDAACEDLAAGQTIVLLARPLSDGALVAVALSIGPSKARTQPAAPGRPDP